jgi:hypothetical protein
MLHIPVLVLTEMIINLLAHLDMIPWQSKPCQIFCNRIKEAISLSFHWKNVVFMVGQQVVWLWLVPFRIDDAETQGQLIFVIHLSPQPIILCPSCPAHVTVGGTVCHPIHRIRQLNGGLGFVMCMLLKRQSSSCRLCINARIGVVAESDSCSTLLQHFIICVNKLLQKLRVMGRDLADQNKPQDG